MPAALLRRGKRFSEAKAVKVDRLSNIIIKIRRCQSLPLVHISIAIRNFCLKGFNVWCSDVLAKINTIRLCASNILLE